MGTSECGCGAECWQESLSVLLGVTAGEGPSPVTDATYLGVSDPDVRSLFPHDSVNKLTNRKAPQIKAPSKTDAGKRKQLLNSGSHGFGYSLHYFFNLSIYLKFYNKKILGEK